MNKLLLKIFVTIFIILNFFLLSLLFIFNYQIYNREKVNISENLHRLNKLQDKLPPSKNDTQKFPGPNFEDNKTNPKRFLDSNIYTIFLDEDNTITEIISHTADGQINANIKDVAQKIINTNQKSTTYIGNLYFNKYSYKYSPNNFLTITDNEDITNRLKTSLWTSLLIFIFAEIIIIAISKILSNWLIKPVLLSFNNQRQFIANASHELKTPLSIIIACSETLEENPDESKWREIIKSEANRMSKLITNLLDLAKIENPTSKELYTITNLSKLIEKSILPFESLAYEKKITLDYTLEENIFFLCHADEITKLISILIDNALNHSPKKCPITVTLKTSKNNIIITVSNKGTPIPKDEEEKIFERFYRLDKSRNRTDNHYGLGLAIAKSIVLKHHGTISASSTNEITTFKVIFPKKEH